MSNLYRNKAKLENFGFHYQDYYLAWPYRRECLLLWMLLRHRMRRWDPITVSKNSIYRKPASYETCSWNLPAENESVKIYFSDFLLLVKNSRLKIIREWISLKGKTDTLGGYESGQKSTLLSQLEWTCPNS